jgi:hypothetical protein
MPPVAAKSRQQLGVAHVDRAGFGIVGDLLEIFRHTLQHLGPRLMRQGCQATRVLGPVA